MRGEIPNFKDIPIKMKKVPVCECKLEKADCEKCQNGYLQRTMRGETPFFMEVEMKEEKSEKGHQVPKIVFHV